VAAAASASASSSNNGRVEAPTCNNANDPTCNNDDDNDDPDHDDDDYDDSSSAHDGSSEKKPIIDWDAFTMYADRHAQRLEAVKSDYDCMEREFDFSDPDFDFTEAAYVYDKCRLIVLKNAYDVEYMEKYRLEFDKYIYGIHTGLIDKSNTPTNDARANDIVQKRGKGRHDIMLPKYLSSAEIAWNPRILQLMEQDLMLGNDVHAHQVGSVIAEKGATAMYWHEDQTWLYGHDGFNHAGIAGHDILPYVINLFVPLGNVTADSGPTEFCMGATHLAGIPEDIEDIFYDERYGHPDSDFVRMHNFQWQLDACPPQFWRRPLIGAGDVVLFDYHLTHRGGPNNSDELRALLYVIYGTLFCLLLWLLLWSQVSARLACASISSLLRSFFSFYSFSHSP
jgi:ectoine hydroxylase-related dioxygenase (phytanoyl-CoA dioxygenase family)